MTETTLPLVGLTGFARAGKDTVAKILCDDAGFVRRAFADLLKTAALEIDPLVTSRMGTPMRLSQVIAHLGWERAKENDEVRRFLQNLGVAMRSLDSDIWVRPVFADLPPRTVISDVRFPNEAEAVLAAGGQIWRVTRPGTAPARNHVSDTALTDFPVDRTITNDGTLEDLRRQVFCV